MGIVSSVQSVETVQGFLLAIALWAFGKALDRVLEWAIGRKVISPAVSSVKWRVKSLWTHFEPIDGTFQISYRIRSELRRAIVKEKLEAALETVEESTRGRVTYTDPTWRGGTGEFSAEHVESNSPFNVELRLIRSNSDLAENPDVPAEKEMVEEVNIKVDFEFAFPKLDSELPNLGVFMTKLKGALDAEFQGDSGPAKIVLHPLESDLSLDEWVERENLKPTLRLTGEDSEATRTQVEFFDDHIALYPPYYEVDSEMIRYVRLLVKHYYLLNSNSDNLLLPSTEGK